MARDVKFRRRSTGGKTGSARMIRPIGRAIMSVVALTGATTSIAQSTPGDVATSQLAIRSMTTIDQEGQGYFEDPYSVRLEPTLKSNMEIISGTTFAVMSCVYPLREDCFSWTPDKIKIGALTRDLIAAKAVVTTFQNLNVFQADNGKWHAVVAADVQARGDMPGKHWTVLLHAHPTTSAPPEVVPLSWTADTILSGSFSDDVQGNYDGKYFEDNGELYLLYVKNLIPEPALRNGIVIRRMISPRQFVSEAPTLLLAPGDRFGPLPSEKFGSTPARLVEAPFIIKLGNKYALIYSTGDYMESDYKAGVAWSDTLIPANGGHYRKVLQEDVAGVWGQPGRQEVHYLLQSQEESWPNYTPSVVWGPGVASAALSPYGAWNLFFAGYDAEDRPAIQQPDANAHHRRPYFVQLHVAVPLDRSVESATDTDLAHWLEPEAR